MTAFVFSLQLSLVTKYRVKFEYCLLDDAKAVLGVGRVHGNVGVNWNAQLEGIGDGRLGVVEV